MKRALWVVCATTTSALAQPGLDAPAITAEPVRTPTTPPAAYPPPPPNAPPSYASYEEPRPRRPDRAFVALGLLAGFGDNWLYGAYAAELGVTILPEDSFRIRARAFGTLYGGTMESDWNGDFWRYGVGAEGRLCSTGAGSCLFVDVDAGYQRLTLYDGNQDFVRSDTGLLLGPRIGFDFGGAIRLRFALEIYEQLGRHNSATSGERFDQQTTVSLSFALGYQL